MKHIWLVVFFLFVSKSLVISQKTGNCNVCCPFDVSTYGDCVDFENLVLGPVIPQSSPQFTLFSANSLNASIVSFPTSANKCMYVENGDIDYNIDRQLSESKSARLEWKMFVQNGKGASIGLETNDPSAYPLVILMSSNQVGTVFRIQNNGFIKLTDFNYQANSWIKFAIIFNPKEDFFELWANDHFVHRVTDYRSNKIADLNIYGDGMTSPNGFYVDDICYREVDINLSCTLEYDPVCVNSKNYSNRCFAELAGYTSCEYYVGECTSSTNEFLNSKINIYPNPSYTGLFSVEDNDIKFASLVDVHGQSYPMVFTQEVIDLRHLPYGIYILSGTKGQLTFATKLVFLR